MNYDHMQLRAEQNRKLTVALARLAGAAKGMQGSIAAGALDAARFTQMNASARQAAYGAMQGVVCMLIAVRDQPEVGEAFANRLLTVMDHLKNSFLTESGAFLEARATQIDADIAALDEIVAYFEEQGINNEIRRGDGRKEQRIFPYGPCETPNTCSLAYGEGTLEDPDICVHCGAKFLRDAEVPFGFDKA
jgi:hypothetical protein